MLFGSQVSTVDCMAFHFTVFVNVVVCFEFACLGTLLCMRCDLTGSYLDLASTTTLFGTT